MSGTGSKGDDGSSGKSTVMAALFANLGIAVAKFVGAALSGSAAMMAEGIHSVVDTGNQGFLLLGMKRAKKPADEKHPFGYGGEIFFYAFIVAVSLFSLGSGLSIYEGVHSILSPPSEGESAFPWIAFTVLVIALAFEGNALRIAIREFRSVRKNRGLIRDLKDMKDPAIFVVMAEDSAACTGLIVAMIGLTMAYLTGSHIWDASASIGIGIILGCVAVLLAIEVKGLLVGEATDPDIIGEVHAAVAGIDEIKTVNDIRTMHLGPHDVLMTMSLDFRDGVKSEEIEAIVTRIEGRTRGKHPDIKKMFIEVQARGDHARGFG